MVRLCLFQFCSWSQDRGFALKAQPLLTFNGKPKMFTRPLHVRGTQIPAPLSPALGAAADTSAQLSQSCGCRLSLGILRSFPGMGDTGMNPRLRGLTCTPGLTCLWHLPFRILPTSTDSRPVSVRPHAQTAALWGVLAALCQVGWAVASREKPGDRGLQQGSVFFQGLRPFSFLLLCVSL